MSIVIFGVTLDQGHYDAEGDVLYLSVGRPQPAAESYETPEGHVLRYNASGALIGATLVGAKAILEREGSITITPVAPPSEARLDSTAVEDALTPA